MKQQAPISNSEPFHQHYLPVSPQNFDPFSVQTSNEKNPNPHQKKLIFSPHIKPRLTLESLTEAQQGSLKVGPREEPSDLRASLSNDLRSQLELVKSDIIQNFTAMLKEHKNSGKINHEEIQEVKKQLATYRNQFEEIQAHIFEVNQKFTEINSLCVKELEEIKAMIGYGGSSYGQKSSLVGSELSQKQLELKFKTLKQNMMNEINVLIKSKSKTRLNENVVNQLKEIKKSFEDELKENFETVNLRVKRVEEHLNEVTKKKSEFLNNLMNEFLVSMKNQEIAFVEEIRNLQNLSRNKVDEQQAKALIRNELSSLIDNFTKEFEKLKKSSSSQKDEIDRLHSQVSRKIDNLESETKRQVYDLQTLVQKKSSNTPNTNVTLLERRIDNLHNDTDRLQRTLRELKSQLEEVQNLYKLIQLQNKQKNEDLINRVESKINKLETQIAGIETQIQNQKRQSYYQEEPRDYVYQTSLTHSQNFHLPYSSSNAKSASAFDSNPIQGISTNDKVEGIDIAPPREEPKSSQKSYTYNSGVFSSTLPNTNYGTSTEVKYYGDPKVKSIIEEFYQKRGIESKDRTYAVPTTYSGEQAFGLPETLKASAEKPSANFSSTTYVPTYIPTSNTYSYSTPFEYTGTKINDNIFSKLTPIKPNNLNNLEEDFNSPSQIADSKISSMKKADLPLSMANHDRSPFRDDQKSPIKYDFQPILDKIDAEREKSLNQYSNYGLPPRHELHKSPTQNTNQSPYVSQIQNSAGRNRDTSDQFHDCIDEDIGDVTGQNDNQQKSKSPYEPTFGDVDNHSNKYPVENKNDPKTNELDRKISEAKKLKHKKIIAQIEFFIHGIVSPLLDENDSEMFCNLDDDGYIFDDEGDYVLDSQGVKVKLTPEEINKFNSYNMIE